MNAPLSQDKQRIKLYLLLRLISEHEKVSEYLIAGIAIELVSPRHTVCTRRVVGTKLVPAEVKPEHIEEIVEWDCEPILSGGAA